MTETDRLNNQAVQEALAERAERSTNGEQALETVLEATQDSLSFQDFDPPKVEARASFDLNTARGQHLWLWAQNAKHGDLVGAGEFEAEIIDWVCWRKDVVRMNGEVEENAWVCCLWTKERGTISFASLLTVKQWAAVARALKSGKIMLPMSFRFVPNASKIKGGNPWYSIIPIMEE